MSTENPAAIKMIESVWTFVAMLVQLFILRSVPCHQPNQLLLSYPHLFDRILHMIENTNRFIPLT